jgi:hypothetical protein
MNVLRAALLPRYTSWPPSSLLATLPWPEDITAMVPVGSMWSWRASMTRSGLSALVTMTRLNSSAEVWATVPSGSLVTPALTNSRSNIRPARRFSSAAIWAGSVTSMLSISSPSLASARSDKPVRPEPRTVAMTFRPSWTHCLASARPRPRDAPIKSTRRPAAGPIPLIRSAPTLPRQYVSPSPWRRIGGARLPWA